MKKFMAVHKEPELSWEIVEDNWRKLAQVETAEWVKTYYNQLLLNTSKAKIGVIFDEGALIS